MTKARLRAREYLRVSKDRSGRARSTEEQHADNLKASEANDWELGDPYGDVSRSASPYAQREREGFQRLIADIEAGRFGADILIFWAGNRGSRRVDEWNTLIRLMHESGIRLHVTAYNRTYDPANHRDWRTLIDDAVDAEYDSRKSSATLKRAMAANADAGRPHGKVLLGYQRRYDPKNGSLIGQVPDPDVAPRIKDMFDRLRRGESIKSIVRLWTEAGYLNGAGRPYDHTFITRLARNPQYAGFRLWEAGRKGGALPSEKAKLIEGDWESIVDRETWYAVQKILNDPARRSNREGKAKYWLTMITVCAVCREQGAPGTVIGRRLHGRRWYYSCQVGHVSVRMDSVDRHVEDVLVAYLEKQNVAEDAADREHDDAEVQKVRDEIVTLRQRRDETESAVASGAMPVEMGGRIGTNLTRQIAEAEARERELTTPAVLDGLFETGPGAWDRWQALSLDRRRKIAAALLVPESLGEVRLHRQRGEPSGPRVTSVQRDPHVDRIEWWRGD